MPFFLSISSISSSGYRRNGFTLIELVLVIVILGIVSAIALPRFVNLEREARVAVIENIQGAAQSTSTIIIARGAIGWASQTVGGRSDLLDVDVDGDGSFETRLKWGYLDNTDLEKWLDLTDDILIEYQGIDRTYFGYDMDSDGRVRDQRCYFRYRQANNAGDVPEFTIATADC